MSKSEKEGDNAEEKYQSFTDTYKTKDLIWEAYYGMNQAYSQLSRKRSNNKAGKKHYGEFLTYAISFYGEVKDFLPKIYTTTEDLKKIQRINELFSKLVIELKSEDVFFVRDYFNTFMVDSGIRNVLYLKNKQEGVNALGQHKYTDLELKK